MLIVFDLDGTLVDTLDDITAAASRLAAEYGGGPLSPAQVARMVGEGAPVLVSRVLASLGIAPAPAGAVERYAAIYAGVLFDRTAAYPGVPELLRRLAPAHDLALLTNKPGRPAVATLEHVGIEAFFPSSVYGDGPFAPKPDPGGLRWLMARHDAAPERTLMVGDSFVDLETARRAGVGVCLARYGFGFEGIPDGALRGDEAIIGQPLDLLEVLAHAC